MNTLFDKYYDVTFGVNDGAALGKAMQEVIMWANTFKSVDDLTVKNDLLCDAVLDRLDTHLIITTLRSTFCIRQFIGCWIDKVDEADVILVKRGLDSRRLLCGLKRFSK